MPRSFFFVRLPAAANFATRRMRRRLGRLSAGIGIDLGIEHENVDVLTLRQHVIQSAVADVVRPAVAAEDPEGLLGQHIGIRDDLACERAGFALANLAVREPFRLIGRTGQIGAVFASREQLLAGFLGTFRIVHLLEPFLAGFLDGFAGTIQRRSACERCPPAFHGAG